MLARPVVVMVVLVALLFQCCRPTPSPMTSSCLKSETTGKAEAVEVVNVAEVEVDEVLAV